MSSMGDTRSVYVRREWRAIWSEAGSERARRGISLGQAITEALQLWLPESKKQSSTMLPTETEN